MIIQTTQPFTPEQITQVSEHFGTYVKTVIDIEKKICIAGMDRHFEGEQDLLSTGSKQSDVWGGGIDVTTKGVDYNSFINIRPNDNNPSNEILDPKIRERYQKLTKYFFENLA